jgi:hypothetical protein
MFTKLGVGNGSSMVVLYACCCLSDIKLSLLQGTKNHVDSICRMVSAQESGATGNLPFGYGGQRFLLEQQHHQQTSPH